MVKNTLNGYISEMMNDKIATALKPETSVIAEVPPEIQPVDADIKTSIVTTEEELQAFNTVKAILSENFDAHRITYKDTVSYFNVLVDNNTWKWICRFRLSEKRKQLCLPTEDKKEERFDIESIDDIFKYSKRLHNIAKLLF